MMIVTEKKVEINQQVEKKLFFLFCKSNIYKDDSGLFS